jgi:hypothetical protein
MAEWVFRAMKPWPSVDQIWPHPDGKVLREGLQRMLEPSDRPRWVHFNARGWISRWHFQFGSGVTFVAQVWTFGVCDYSNPPYIRHHLWLRDQFHFFGESTYDDERPTELPNEKMISVNWDLFELDPPFGTWPTGSQLRYLPYEGYFPFQTKIPDPPRGRWTSPVASISQATIGGVPNLPYVGFNGKWHWMNNCIAHCHPEPVGLEENGWSQPNPTLAQLETIKSGLNGLGYLFDDSIFAEQELSD